MPVTCERAGHTAMMLDTACGVDRDVLSHICVCAGPGVRGPDTSVCVITLSSVILACDCDTGDKIDFISKSGLNCELL